MKSKILTLTLLALLLGAPGAMAQKNRKPKPAKSAIMHQGWIDFNKNGRKDVYEDPTRTIDERIDDLLAQMTLEEKTCQLATLYGFGRVLQDSLPTPRWKDEIVQLYFSDLVTSMVSYESQLRGFERVSLKAGESKVVTFRLDRTDLQLLDKDMHWVVEPGDFEFRVGASSEDIRLRQTITLNDKLSLAGKSAPVSTEPEHYSVPK